MVDIKNFVKKTLRQVIKEEYPHLSNAGAVRAKVVSVKRNGSVSEYRLQMLDRNGGADSKMPEIPGVLSDQAYNAGDEVAVILLYGLLQPYIVGRYAG